jgi:probable rRNA maturation factor
MPVVIGMRLTRWPLRLGALKQLAMHVLQAVGEAEALSES